jgi:hypothetical protein
MSNKKFREKRRYQRLTIPVPLKFKFLHMRGILKDAVAQNISGGGIALSLGYPAEKNTRLKILLYFPSSSRPVTALSEVMWCRKISVRKGKKYDVGVKYIKIMPRDRERFVFLFCEMMVNYLALGRTK